MIAAGWFWIYYAAAWTPYAAALVAVFVSNGARVSLSIAAALEYTIPAALLGAAAFPLCRRLRWRAGVRGRVLAIHGVSAIVFAVLATAGAVALMSVERRRVVQPSFGIVRFHFNANVLAYAAVAAVAYAVDSARRLREEERRRTESELLRVRAELQSLRGHLNPHFLFNAIHSLITLTRQDVLAAEAGLEQLGALLRYSLREVRNDEQDVPVKDEWVFVNDYLALERLRLGDRLRVDMRVDPKALDDRMLPFLLQPLVENAVRYAVASRAAGGHVRISIRREDQLIFEVTDDGPGADIDMVERSTGLGLRSVRQRVACRYPDAGDVTVTTSPGAGFSVRVAIPMDDDVPGAR